MTNDTEQSQTLQFDGKTYKVSDMTETQEKAASDAVSAQNYCSQKRFEAQMAQIAQNTIWENLREALKDCPFTEIPEEVMEASSETPDTATLPL